MKKPKIILRILCGLLDAILIMLPIQLIMMGIFQVSTGQADLLYKFLFAVYGTLLTEYRGGTIGKYFGKLCCVDVNGGKPPIMYVGIRELTKSLYFVPVFGWAAAAISLVMLIVRKDGRMLHDFVGNTRVVYQWQAEEEAYGDK